MYCTDRSDGLMAVAGARLGDGAAVAVALAGAQSSMPMHKCSSFFQLTGRAPKRGTRGLGVQARLHRPIAPLCLPSHISPPSMCASPLPRLHHHPGPGPGAELHCTRCVVNSGAPAAQVSGGARQAERMKKQDARFSSTPAAVADSCCLKQRAWQPAHAAHTHVQSARGAIPRGDGQHTSKPVAAACLAPRALCPPTLAERRTVPSPLSRPGAHGGRAAAPWAPRHRPGAPRALPNRARSFMQFADPPRARPASRGVPSPSLSGPTNRLKPIRRAG